MGLAVPQLTFTEEEYLGFERASQDRHTYLDGQVFLMAGESIPHGEIGTNVTVSLGSQLKGKPCRVRQGNTRVRSGPRRRQHMPLKGLYSYPDVMVVCGEVDTLDEHRDVVTNPTVVVEVLSPSTAAFDRGTKLERNKKHNPTLTDYILISQDRPFVEYHRRRPDGTWAVRLIAGLDATFRIASVGCTLALADVYDRVNFPPES